MPTIKKFEEIEAWQKARLLSDKIHWITLETPLSKDSKLRDQINGSSGSVMDNIGERFGRGGNAEFLQFLEISNGSLCELQSQLYSILDRKCISEELFKELYRLTEEIKGKLLGLINYLKTCQMKGPKYKNRDLGKT